MCRRFTGFRYGMVFCWLGVCFTKNREVGFDSWVNLFQFRQKLFALLLQ